MLRGTACLLIALFGFGQGAAAQDWLRTPAAPQAPAAAPSAGSLSGRVRVGSATIALPPGQWALAAEEVRGATSSAGGPISSRLEQKIFYQLERGVLVSMVSIGASAGYNSNGWIMPRGCQRRDVFYVHNEAEYESSFDCLRINHIILTRARDKTRSPIWAAAYERIARAAPLPNQMIVAEYNYLRSNRGEFVDVSVFVNPETAGIRSRETGWLASPWHRSNADADHRAFLELVARWAEGYRRVVRAAWE